MPLKPDTIEKGPIHLFLSYARDDDESFVRRLYEDLKRQTEDGKPLFEVWFDRESMPSRQLTFHHEIRNAVNACDRLLLVIGPNAVQSDYVTQEWQFAYFVANKCVNPIVRLDGTASDGTRRDGYDLIPEELKVHAEDFRDDRRYAEHLERLVRQLSEPLPPVGKLVAVPELPPGFRAQPERLKVLRDLLLVDLRKPVVVSGARARVGVQGMGGIGKSVLANAMARHPEVRRAFKDGIYWITLGQRPNPVETQRWLARQLGDNGAFENETVGRERLRDLLRDREALLILDNVWQRAHAEAFNVIGPLGRILLTTRDTGLVTALASRENHFQVDLPSQSEAELLLAAAAQVEPAELRASKAAREIVNQCGRLPLALALCGGMVQGGTSWKDVLDALKDHDLAFLSTDHPAEEQHQNIWTAMNVSLSVLPREQQERFAELAVFGLDTGAVDTAVATLWEHTGGITPRESRKLLTDFARRSLVGMTDLEGDWEAPRRKIVLHDLLHSFAAGMAVKRFGSEKELHSLLLAAYRKNCPDGWHRGPNDGYFLQNLFRHLLALDLWDQLIGDESQPGILSDLRWIESKAQAGQVFELVDDYNEALATLPEFQEEAEHERQRIARCKRYWEELILYAKDPDVHPLPEPPPTGGSEAKKEIPEDHSDRAWLLRHFANFVNGSTGYLIRFPAQTMEMAANHAAEGPVAESGRKHLDKSGRPCLLSSPCLPITRPLRPQCLRTLEGHTDWVWGVSITPDGTRAVSASSDNTLRVWDLQTGQCLRTIEDPKGWVLSVSITPDARRAVSGSKYGTLRVWDLQTGQCLCTLEGHTSSVACVSITPDARRAVSGSKYGTLRVWDLQTGQCLRTLFGYTDSVNSVSITPDGTRAVSASGDETLRVWDLETGQCLRTLGGRTRSVRSISITPDGTRVVSASDHNTLRVWDLQTGQCLRTLFGHTDSVNSISVTPDGRRAVSASNDRTLRVWDLQTGQCLRTIEGHTNQVESVSITPDGTRAVSGSWDTTLRVWDMQTGQCLRALKGHTGSIYCVSITPDATRAVSASNDRTLRVWDMQTGQCLRTLFGHTDSVNSISVTPDGTRAVSGSWDNTLRVWDLQTGQCLRTLEGHTGWVNIVITTPDGTRAVSASNDRTLRVWDMQTGQCLRTLEGHESWLKSVSITPDGTRAVSASADKALRVWDLQTGQCLRTLQGHTGPVESVSTTPDGTRVVSASADNTLRVWDLQTGQCLRTLFGHTDSVNSISVTPDGRRAVSASTDSTLRVWDLESGKCLAMYNAFSNFTDVASSGDKCVCGSEDGQVRFLTLRNFPPNGPAIMTVSRINRRFDPPRFFHQARCVVCAAIFEPPAIVIDTIKFFADICSQPGQSKSSNLYPPDSAFEDPRLLAACPHCGKPLKFNPFFVDIHEQR